LRLVINISTMPCAVLCARACAGDGRRRLIAPRVQKDFGAEELKTMNGADGIDPTVKEKYLSDEEHFELFSMDKAAFAALPLWKRQQQKKRVGLF
jgi:Villin headpiece domain